MSDKDISRALRLCAHLLRYPDAAMRADLPALREALVDERAFSKRRQMELDRLAARLHDADGLASEAGYVDVFDRSRATSLHLFEHVHGDSRDRGPAMIALNETYAAAGLRLAPGELPDYLPVVLEFASTQPPAEAKAFVAEFAHLLNAVFTVLERRGSPYAAAIAALLELAGERARPVDVPADLPLDEAWEEPPAFGGCSIAGQSRTDAPQPVRLIRNAAPVRPGVPA
jgi:nitrate reductase delta subunit